MLKQNNNTIIKLHTTVEKQKNEIKPSSSHIAKNAYEVRASFANISKLNSTSCRNKKFC